jgi:uncharacterized protein (TIGR02646 family)
MRYIETETLVPPAEWLKKAQAAQLAIAAVGNLLATAQMDQIPGLVEQLKALIRAKAKLWGEFKTTLQNLSDNKCWYCEAKQSRSDMAVDHFRPKNEVQGCDQHHGYWWLALDYKNFRLACNFCNSLHDNQAAGKSLGKGTYFPLVDEAARIFDPTDDMSAENPSLLDPTVALDPNLLTFVDDGRAVPAYPEDSSKLFFHRASTSIDVYNLNDQRVKEERFIIAQTIKREVARAERHLNDAQEGQPAAVEHFQEVYRVILKLIAAKAEFSAAARAILAGYKEKAWVMRALSTA